MLQTDRTGCLQFVHLSIAARARTCRGTSPAALARETRGDTPPPLRPVERPTYDLEMCGRSPEAGQAQMPVPGDELLYLPVECRLAGSRTRFRSRRLGIRPHGGRTMVVVALL